MPACIVTAAAAGKTAVVGQDLPWHEQHSMNACSPCRPSDGLTDPNKVVPLSTSFLVADCTAGYYMNGTQSQPSATCLTCIKGSYCECP